MHMDYSTKNDFEVVLFVAYQVAVEAKKVHRREVTRARMISAEHPAEAYFLAAKRKSCHPMRLSNR